MENTQQFPGLVNLRVGCSREEVFWKHAELATHLLFVLTEGLLTILLEEARQPDRKAQKEVRGQG